MRKMEWINLEEKGAEKKKRKKGKKERENIVKLMGENGKKKIPKHRDYYLYY